MSATIGLPGLLLLLASPAGIVPGALFVLINGAIILNGMN